MAQFIEKPDSFILLCPTCKKEVAPSHKDDVQQWYRCEAGHQTANPIKQELDWVGQFAKNTLFPAMEKLTEMLEPLALDPNLEQVFLNDLHRIVAAHDDHVTKANFHTALSMYYVPVNNAVKGESGVGKTYGTLEVISYFPEEDVIIVGSQSPKVISHEHGKFMTGNDEPLSWDNVPQKPSKRDFDTDAEYKEAWDGYRVESKIWEDKIRNSYHLIRLTGKTYVFLDTISYETFEMFKCTLSHDKPRIAHKYVDDKGKVHKAVLDGWPSAIFCSTDKKWIEEFSTRTFTVSPSTAKEKITAGMEITSQKKSYPWKYKKDTQTKLLLKALIREIRDTFKKYDLKVVCPFPDIEKLFTSTATRDMRDYNHFTEILPAYAMFKLFQRPIASVDGEKWLVVSIEDVKAAKALFDEIAETTKTGTEKRIIDFYETFVQPKTEGITLNELVEEYNDENLNDTKSDYAIRGWLKRLNQIGWVNILKGQQEDKRKDTFIPLKLKHSKPKIKGETSGKNENQLDLDAELKKQFKTWLETISDEGIVTGYEILDFKTKQLQPLTGEKFVEKTVGVDLDTLLIVSEAEKNVNSETELKSSGKTENQPVSLI
jgi:hypothetical protein